MLLVGRDLFETKKQILIDDVKGITERMGRAPTLHVILVGAHAPSQLYVEMKKKRAQEVGIKTVIHHFEKRTPHEIVASCLNELNQDPLVDGILIQLPLPPHLVKVDLLNMIHPLKDVDGLSAINLGLLMQGQAQLIPCTPQGCMALIHEWKKDLQGFRAVVVGRSTLVGIPLSLLLTQAHATVTLCHTFTKNLEDITITADIVVAACGSPNLIRKEFIKEGACVIDVGSTKLPNGKVVGDVDFDDVEKKAGALSPVPFGVGPMTIYYLLQNTVLAAKSNYPTLAF